ncbi:MULTISPECIES: bacillithiol system redox-active protein YtxJ [unclassified Aureispira]|uniref:bacillithiol system redox-active protein YtxJ n=1 Tax=unclassified Aureispira TaxID=2649989 RepID=UPI000698770A|nr:MULTISPECIES: bacillithiol system redox-active protein YtxJ [unclassified Aureispira]WMX12230.1 bacillithiol system redox-active protein YtxJ [Aureispira sp. CCB-E]
MKWKELNNINDLETALKASYEQPVALFKHSTRCSVSLMAKKSVERFWDLDIDAYYLDLIAHRDVSNAIADQLNIEHQSPQMILVKEGKAIYNASHGSIDVDTMGDLL